MSMTARDLGTRLLLDPVLAVVFPSHCLACQALLAHPTRGPLCATCWTALPRHAPHAVCTCGAPGRYGAPCGRCRRGLTPYSAGLSLGPFEGTLRLLVHELKYHGRRRLAQHLAERLLARPECARMLTRDALLVPVPLHPRRLAERGYNQAELVARALAERARLEIAPGALVRRRETGFQTGLSAAQRRANVAGAFAVRARGRLAGRVVVLIDDVITTGATAHACATTLKEAGASDVRLVTLARAT
jgi:ComF family protein